MMLYFKEKRRKAGDDLKRRGGLKTVLFAQGVISRLLKIPVTDLRRGRKEE